jgi:F-type H+-transporting ATPase subunit delta
MRAVRHPISLLRVIDSYVSSAPRRDFPHTVSVVPCAKRYSDKSTAEPVFSGLGSIERVIVATAGQAVSGVAGRYASALFDLATEAKSVTQTADALTAFGAVIEGSDDVKRLMRSPVFKTEDQLAAVEALASKAKVGGLALNFLKLMASNRRLAALPDAIQSFNTLVAQAKGEATAEVTSAEKLTPKQITDLKAALKSTIGSDVALTTKVDASILGGLIVKVGSRMMDNSLKTKLANLKVAMKGSQ